MEEQRQKKKKPPKNHETGKTSSKMAEVSLACSIHLNGLKCQLKGRNWHNEFFKDHDLTICCPERFALHLKI